MGNRDVDASIASTNMKRPSGPKQLVFSQCCLQVQMTAEHIRLASTRVQPDCALSLEANQISQQQMSTASSLADILRRPHIHYRFLVFAFHLQACTCTERLLTTCVLMECFMSVMNTCVYQKIKWTTLAQISCGRLSGNSA